MIYTRQNRERVVKYQRTCLITEFKIQPSTRVRKDTYRFYRKQITEYSPQKVNEYYLKGLLTLFCIHYTVVKYIMTDRNFYFNCCFIPNQLPTSVSELSCVVRCCVFCEAVKNGVNERALKPLSSSQ